MEIPEAFYVLLKKHLEEANWQEAINLLSEPVLKKANDGYLLRKRAEAHFMIEQYQDALKFNQWANVISAQGEDDIFLEAHIWKALGEFQLAKLKITRCIDINPLAEYYAFRGYCNSKLNFHRGSIDDFSVALSIENRNAEYFYGRGCQYFSNEQLAESIADFKQAIEINHAEISFRIALIETYLKSAITTTDDQKFPKKSLLADAATEVDLLFALDPFNHFIYLAKARIALEFENFESALSNISTYLLFNPDKPEGYFYRGLAWLLNKEYQKAAQDFEIAIEDSLLSQISLIGFYYRIGYCYQQLNQYARALDYFRRANTESDGVILFQIAEALFALEKFEEAIIEFTKCIVLNPKDSYNWARKAEAHKKLSQIELALNDLTIAISIENDPSYLISRGLILMEIFQYEKAIEDFTAAKELSISDANSYLLLGTVYLYKKEYALAIKECDCCIKYDPNNIQALQIRGIAYGANWQNDLAERDFTQVINLNPAVELAYYTRAVAKLFQKKYESASEDLIYFIGLKQSPTYYFPFAAKYYLSEISKIRNSAQYRRVFELVYEIKELLTFKGTHITHYTGLTTARKLVVDNSLFFISQASYLNDPLEGRAFLETLGLQRDEKTGGSCLKIKEEHYSSKPYIGSFVNAIKQDDLGLWRMYGKEGGVDAAGCSFTIRVDKFQNLLTQNLINKENVKHLDITLYSELQFYSVAYVSKDRFSIPGSQNQAETRLSEIIEEIRDTLKLMPHKEEVFSLINSIAYLFKASEFESEQEVRLVAPETGFDNSLKESFNPPRTVIELANLSSLLSSVVLGPKVEKQEEWAALFNSCLNNKYYKSPTTIYLSKLPYK